MTSTAAQDEYNAMMSRNTPSRLRSHPSDTSSHRRRPSSSGSTTLAPSTLSPSSASTITHRNAHRSRNSLASALETHRPRPTSSGSFYHDSSSADEADEPDTPDDARDSSDSDGQRTVTKQKGPSKYYLPAEWDSNAMTGPKGVIADAAAFEREKRGKRSNDWHRTKDLKLPRAQQFGGSTSPKRRGTGSRSGSASEGISEEEDRAMNAWREKRMKELREGSSSRQSGRKTSMARGRDEVKVVDGEGFLSAVEGGGRGCVTVVLITDDENPLSTTFSQALYSISRKYPSHSFISLCNTDAEIDEAACPAILAYKNGNQFAQVMPLADEVGTARNIVSNLEECLRRRDILGSRFDIEGF